MINKGPWSQLDDDEPFIDGVPPKPPQADFYPDDITKDEFNTWVAGLSPEEKEKAIGYFYTIRRDAGGKLKSVPYSEEYREFLDPAAKLLREAGALTANETLKNFLEKRAQAFGTNDYYDSDVAWMDLDSPIEVTIGPYETYEGFPASKSILQYNMWNVTPTELWNWDELKTKVAKHGLRNSLLVAPMPTASTSQILGFNVSRLNLIERIQTTVLRRLYLPIRRLVSCMSGFSKALA